jgi:hypothetical protein
VGVGDDDWLLESIQNSELGWDMCGSDSDGGHIFDNLNFIRMNLCLCAFILE